MKVLAWVTEGGWEAVADAVASISAPDAVTFVHVAAGEVSGATGGALSGLLGRHPPELEQRLDAAAGDAAERLLADAVTRSGVSSAATVAESGRAEDAPDGTVGPIQTVSTAYGCCGSTPRVAVDTAGQGHVIWHHYPFALKADFKHFQVLERPVSTSGTLGSVAVVTNGFEPEEFNPSRTPDVVASFANGSSLVVWSVLSRATQAYVKGHRPRPDDPPLRARVLTRTGQGRAMTISSRRDLHALFPEVVASGTRATVAWQYAKANRRAQSGATEGLHSRSVTDTGAMGPIATVRKTRNKEDAVMLASSLSVGPSGRVALSWVENLFGQAGHDPARAQRRSRVYLSILK